MLSALPKTWLVVPCYNEGERLPVAKFEEFLRRQPEVKMCFVNDGSRDHTAEVLRRLAERNDDRVVVLNLQRNHGKAEAVRRGVLHAIALEPAAYVGYWDADLATPLEELPRFLAAAEEYEDLVVLCGCRLKRLGAVVQRRWRRHLLGRLFATIASTILRLPIYDTQCGAKLIDVRLARRIFATEFISAWCFDVELLARTVAAFGGREQAAGHIVEIPLRKWCDVAGSKLRLRHFLVAGLDLVRIWWRYGPRFRHSPGLGNEVCPAIDPQPAVARAIRPADYAAKDLQRVA